MILFYLLCYSNLGYLQILRCGYCLTKFFTFIFSIVETGFWTKVMTIGEGPSARFSVAGDCLDPLKSGVLVFIGGCNKSLEALDDMYYLYTGLAQNIFYFLLFVACDLF